MTINFGDQQNHVAQGYFPDQGQSLYVNQSDMSDNHTELPIEFTIYSIHDLSENLLRTDSQAFLVFANTKPSILANAIIRSARRSQYFDFEIDVLFERIVLACYKHNIPLPMDFFKHILEEGFPDFGSASHSTTNILELSRILTRNILLGDNAKLQTFVDEKCAMNNKKVRALLTLLACKYHSSFLLDLLIKKQLLLNDLCDKTFSTVSEYNPINWLFISGNVNTLRQWSELKHKKAAFKKSLSCDSHLFLALKFKKKNAVSFYLERTDKHSIPKDSLIEMTKMAICDPESYWVFDEIIPLIGDSLFSHIDPYTQKTLLHTAIDHKNTHATTKILELFCSSGSDPLDPLNNFINKKGVFGKTALMNACENEFVDGVRLLIEHGADIELIDNKGNTAIHYAAASSSPKVLAELLSKGIPLKFLCENKFLKSIFDFSYVSTDFSVNAKLLILIRAALKQKSHKLYQDFILNLVGSLSVLLSTPDRKNWLTDFHNEILKKCDMHEQSTIKSILLETLCAYQLPEDVMEQFLDSFSSVPLDLSHFSNRVQFFYYLVRKKVEEEKLIQLFELNKELAFDDYQSNRALFFALQEGMTELVKLFISTNKDLVNITTKNGHALLHYVELSHGWDFIKFLLDNGADINQPFVKADWKTPFYVCLHISVLLNISCDEILQYQPDVNHMDSSKDTLLHHALRDYDSSLDPKFRVFIMSLLKCGANPNIKNKQGVTPIHLFMKWPDLAFECIEFLEDAIRENINTPDKKGVTPYHIACQYMKSTELLQKFALEYQANPALVTHANESVLHFLANNPSITKFDSIIEGAEKHLFLMNHLGTTPLEIAIYRGGNKFLVVHFQKPIINQFNNKAKRFGFKNLIIHKYNEITQIKSPLIDTLSKNQFSPDLFYLYMKLLLSIGLVDTVVDTINILSLTKDDLKHLIDRLKRENYCEVEKISEFLRYTRGDRSLVPIYGQTIPQADSDVSINELLDMMRKVNPEAQTKLKNIEKMVETINGREPYLGAPNKEELPEEFEMFYQQLENLIRHFIIHLRHIDSEEQKNHLDYISSKVATMCCTRWNEEFTMLYYTFSNESMPTSFPEEILLSLQHMRKKILLNMGGSDPHRQNLFTGLIAEDIGIAGATYYKDTSMQTTPQERENYKKQCLELFKHKYQPHKICMYLRNAISDLYSSEIKQSMILNWLNEFVPKTYKAEHFGKLLDEVQNFKGEPQEIRSYLESQGVALGETNDFETFIEEERIYDFKMNAFDTLGDRTTLSLSVLFDLLTQENVLTPISLRSSQQNRKRSDRSVSEDYELGGPSEKRAKID